MYNKGDRPRSQYPSGERSHDGIRRMSQPQQDFNIKDEKNTEINVRLEKLVIMSFYVVRCPQTLQAQLDVYMKVTPPKS